MPLSSPTFSHTLDRCGSFANSWCSKFLGLCFTWSDGHGKLYLLCGKTAESRLRGNNLLDIGLTAVYIFRPRVWSLLEGLHCAWVLSSWISLSMSLLIRWEDSDGSDCQGRTDYHRCRLDILIFFFTTSRMIFFKWASGFQPVTWGSGVRHGH